MSKKSILVALDQMGVEYVQDLLTKQELVSEIYHSETSFSSDHQFVFIYRPLEQWVDAKIRSEIVDIKTNNKLFKRLKLLKGYNKIMRDKQILLMNEWKVFMQSAMILHKSIVEQSCILRFHYMKEDLNKWMNLNNDLDISIFTNVLPFIENYTNKEILEIHNYFTNSINN